jgi:hypothetical protein
MVEDRLVLGVGQDRFEIEMKRRAAGRRRQIPEMRIALGRLVDWMLAPSDGRARPKT